MIPRSLNEQGAGIEALANGILSRVTSSINCCLPGIVRSYDPAAQTAVIQPAVRKRIRTQAGVKELDYPLLTDVPVLILGGGQHFLSMPIQAGDECIVLFSDVCMDAWWQSGEVQGQIIARQHDLSDGFAIVGFRSRPNALSNLNTVYPEISDFVIDGKRFSEWIASSSSGAYFDDENETLVLGGDDDAIQAD